MPSKKPRLSNSETAHTAEELEEKVNKMKRKVEIRENLKKKKGSSKPKALTKTERRRIKAEKLQKLQKIQSIKNVMANGTIKKNTKVEKKIKEDPEEQNGTTVKDKTFNKEGKIIFSKVQIEGEKKKSKKGQSTNPTTNLQKLKSQKKKIKELIESGDKMKAKEEKQKMLWETAFDKTSGVKVKDNEEILKKTIKKRKVLKKKSKEKWSERKKKVEEKQSTKSKKREENINKRKTDNQKIKLKKAVKTGRVF